MGRDRSDLRLEHSKGQNDVSQSICVEVLDSVRLSIPRFGGCLINPNYHVASRSGHFRPDSQQANEEEASGVSHLGFAADRGQAHELRY